jgi:protein-disulfide isomerase
MSRRTPELSVSINRADHTRGPRDALVTVVEYADFECPKCKQAAGGVELLLARLENHVQLAFRHFPVESIHPLALLAAQASECAGAQGKFWEMHDLLFENQLRLELPHLFEYATSLGLDMARFEAEMRDRTHLPRVRDHQRSGADSSVRSTPAFFVNGRIQDVSFGVQSLIDAAEASLRSGMARLK